MNGLGSIREHYGAHYQAARPEGPHPTLESWTQSPENRLHGKDDPTRNLRNITGLLIKITN